MIVNKIFVILLTVNNTSDNIYMVVKKHFKFILYILIDYTKRRCYRCQR